MKLAPLLFVSICCLSTALSSDQNAAAEDSNLIIFPGDLDVLSTPDLIELLDHSDEVKRSSFHGNFRKRILGSDPFEEHTRSSILGEYGKRSDVDKVEDQDKRTRSSFHGNYGKRSSFHGNWKRSSFHGNFGKKSSPPSLSSLHGTFGKRSSLSSLHGDFGGKRAAWYNKIGHQSSFDEIYGKRDFLGDEIQNTPEESGQLGYLVNVY